MKKITKKFPLALFIVAAVLVCAIVLLCIFAMNKNTTPTEGTVFLNAGSTVMIDYDAAGNVLKAHPVNGSGAMLMEQIDNYINAPVKDLATRLLTEAKDYGYLEGLNTVILMQTLDSAPAGITGFLPELRDHIQSQVGENCTVVLITTDDLTETGYINFDTAEKLMKLYINNKRAKIVGDPLIIGGYYGMYVTLDDAETFYQMDASSGDITEGDFNAFYSGTEETLSSDSDDTEPTEYQDPEYNFDGSYSETEETLSSDSYDTEPTEYTEPEQSDPEDEF